MSERVRLRLFLVFGPIFLGLYVYAAMNLPPWGHYRGPYGDAIARLAVYERHATDAVNAINYDYRGMDTLGEEFILFAAVVGVMLLLRREDAPTKEKKKPGSDADREGASGMARVPGTVADRPPLSETVRAAMILATGLTVIFGLYIGLHGQLTPGGGFQAGVILATAAVLVYLADNTEAFTRIASARVLEAVEAMGASLYALIGVLPLLIGAPFLTNILPLGTTGDVFSSGNIALISACVGVEVTAAFLLVTYTYLEEIIRGEVPEK